MGLKQTEAGFPVKEVRRQQRFSAPSFYTWRAKIGVMTMLHYESKEQPANMHLQARLIELAGRASALWLSSLELSLGYCQRCIGRWSVDQGADHR